MRGSAERVLTASCSHEGMAARGPRHAAPISRPHPRAGRKRQGKEPLDAETSIIDIPTPDGVADGILAAPTNDGPYPGVLVWMDAFGLRPRLDEMALRIACEGYVVLVPNAFYRSGRAPVIPLGDLSDPAQRSGIFPRLRPMMQQLTPERVRTDAAAYLDWFTEEGRVTDGKVATVGYCMGGAHALRTAALAPERVSAVATFHAGRLVTDDPESPHRVVQRISGEVYVAHADHDASMAPDAQAELERALQDAGVTYRTELYEGAAHGFTMADTAAYDEAATERHWQRLFDLLVGRLPA